MVIKMGDRVVDSSIRTKLEKLERQLLAIQLQN
jgi:F-type H+-transporting ATPase subunit delta